MKKLKFLGVVAMATVLLTSCLDGGNNEREGSAYGVIDLSMDAMANVAYTDDNTPVYASAFTNLTNNDCILFAYKINYDDPVNSGQNKYLTATVSQYVKLDKGQVETVVDSTNESIRPNEMAAVDAGVVTMSAYSTTVKNYLFIGSNHEKSSSDQNNSYILQINPVQEPEVVDGKNVYDFFLRVIKNSDGKNTIGSTTYNYVFPAGHYISSLEAKEKGKGSDAFYFRINYIKEFNKDSTEATWGKSKVMGYNIYKGTN